MISAIAYAAFRDELTKISGVAATVADTMGNAAKPLADAASSGKLFKSRVGTMALGGTLAALPVAAGLHMYGKRQADQRELDLRRQGKIASDLTPEARAHIAPKNFALTAKQSDTGKPAYPIQDKAHARSALGLVGMHGDAKEKAEVYKDVARKFPELARGKEKDGGMEAGPQPSGTQPLPGMARGGPPGGTGMQMGLGGA